MVLMPTVELTSLVAAAAVGPATAEGTAPALGAATTGTVDGTATNTGIILDMLVLERKSVVLGAQGRPAVAFKRLISILTSCPPY